MEPRIDRITYSYGPERRTPKAGDEKYVKGVLMVRQQRRYAGMCMVSNGKPLWEWVEWGSERDQMRCKGRYRTMRHGIPVPPPPEGWKILEAGKVIPREHMVFIQQFTASGEVGWFGATDRAGREAELDSVQRAFAVRKSEAELTRDDFEKHCVCISEGHMAKQPASVSAEAAIKKYTARCKCPTVHEVTNAAD